MNNASNEIFRSVVFQLLLSMLLVSGMALASMSMSVLVTLQAQDDAEAVNLAGSLRMQSYRIANLLASADQGVVADPRARLVAEREQFSAKLVESAISHQVAESRNTPLAASYRQVRDRWGAQIEPLLASAGQPEADWGAISRRYSEQLEPYVSEIDHMVTLLQRDAEGKIELLGMTEGFSIMLIIIAVLFAAMKADKNFVVPLRALVDAAERVEKGDLSHRLEFAGANELGRLSQTFNSMMESLQAHYRSLEDHVSRATDELRRSNQALSFLYKTSRELTPSPHDHQLLDVFLRELKQVADVESINLCVSSRPNFPDYDYLGTGSRDEFSCVGDCSECQLSGGSDRGTSGSALCLPIRIREDVFGFLNVRARTGHSLLNWQKQLLNTVAETLSTAFAFHHSLGQERRLILLEERSAIARELHDSLAQSLSYMKMETARLRKMIERGYEPAMVDSALSDLQAGLNAAYKHLRELLVTFRVKLEAPDLHTALQHAVQEFDQQTAATVSLDYRLGGHVMSPNEDIHVLHIVREALNNAVKHSGAEHIRLRCWHNQRGEAIFCVEDDGVGIPEEPEKDHHYGLYTMRERAAQLGGVLSCDRLATGGTRVALKIPREPALLRA